MDVKLQSTIEQSYNLENIEVLDTLGTKGGRKAYKIGAGNLNYVIKISSSDKNADQIIKDTEILLFLNLNHIPSPKLLKTRGGASYLQVEDKYLYIYEFVEGKHPFPSVAFFQKLGVLLARLHSLPINKYPHQSNFNPEHEFIWLKKELLKVTNPNQKDMLQELLDEIDGFPDFSSLPQSIIHTDPYFFNLLEGNSNELYLIDLDDAGIASSIIDVGYVLAHMCIMTAKDRAEYNIKGDNDKISYHSNWAEEFLSSYQEIRPLTDQELKMLPYAAIFTMLVYIQDGEENRINQNNFDRYKKIKDIV